MRMTIVPTNRFKKDLKKVVKRGNDLRKINIVISKIANYEALDKKHQDHPLGGNWIGYRECHIEPDWLLIYKIENDFCVLTLTRTGSHSDLFEQINFVDKKSYYYENSNLASH